MTVILSKKASKKNAVPNRIQVQVRVRNIPTWRPGKSAKSRSYHSNLSKLAHDSPLRDQLCLDVLSNNSVKVSYPDESRKRADKLFCYDRVYSPLDSQEEFYNGAASGLIEKCLEGYNGCIFAYGQTASGKSYTMHGLLDAPATNEYPKERGLIHRAVEQITKHIHSYSTGKKRVENLIGDKMRMEFSVKASFLEIYQEQLKDLLCEDGAQADLRIRMDPESVTGKDLHVQGLTERHVAELKDYLKVLEIGAKHRTVAETNMNEVSSRSHAVFTLTIEQTQWRESDQSIASRKRSKIHFIDLAGSERADATGAVGARLKEGSMINQSLLSLGNVISALSKRPSTKDDQGHQKYIPYRDSKLTYLLSDSLGGNSLTLMVACVTPTGACYDESISTLRFAERAKKVTNNARVNLDATSLKILELEGEIHRLKTLLSKCSCGIAEESGSSLMMKITKWIPVSSLRVCLGLESSEVVTKTTLTTVEQEDDDQAEPSTPRSPVPIWRQKPRMPRLESLRNFKRILPAVPPAAA